MTTQNSLEVIKTTTPDILPEVIFPNNKNEIQDWALKYWIINSYDNYSNEEIAWLRCVWRFQKELLKTLIKWEAVSENQKDFIIKTQHVVQLLKSSTIWEWIKKTIIETIATDDNPWMHDWIFSNMVKQINCEEIIPNELVQIQNIDYHNPVITTIWGVQWYVRPNNPSEIYNHCLNIKDFSELEKKIIAMCVDQKPYRTNHTLLTRKVDTIKDITFNREKWVIQFITGSELHDAFSRYYFLHIIFSDLSRDEYWAQVHERNVEEKQEKVLTSDWFKNFKPDFAE